MKVSKVRFRSYSLWLILCLPALVLAVLSSFAKAGGQTAVAIRGSVQVDGVEDDVWEDAKKVTTAIQVKSESTLQWEQCAKASVRWLWNDGQLFFLADVADAVISTKNGNSWAQDSLEIFVDENRSRTNGFDDDDCHYRISAIGTLSTAIHASEKNIKFKVVPMTGGYRIEGAIKFKTDVLKSGAKIGLEIQVNDDPGTGQRDSISKWAHGENDSWQRTKNYGTLVLVENSSQLDGKAKDEKGDGGKTPQAKVKTIPVSTGGAHSKWVPDWAKDAVFYQIFPERFRNGDSRNDPKRGSLEFPDVVPGSWSVTPWTQQWYARSPWEKAMGDDFYEDGVFHRRYGGDLQGVIDKLDYLSDLGINTIYFNPVFYAKSLHKYDGNSFHHIDPQFGPDPEGDFKLMVTETADVETWKWTAADKLFLKLLQLAHERKIRIIIDGVFNHTGRDFFAFKDLSENQEQSRYRHWYMVDVYDDPNTDKSEFKYKGWWGVDTLPEFANNFAGDDLHPEPKAYVMQATARWMDPNGDGDPSDGIDGWRLDVANEVPNKFWQDWNRHVRKLNPDAYTVAEIWDNAAAYLANCGFSATMNYHGFAFPAKGFLIDGRMTAKQFADCIAERMLEHGEDVRFALQNLFDSHDTDRLASMVVNSRHQRSYTNRSRFDYDVRERVSRRYFKDYDINGPNPEDKRLIRLAALFQMTFVGAPMVYYGTEVGMDGGDDPDDRMPMVWDDLQYETRTLGPKGRKTKPFQIKVDQDLYGYYKRLVKMRTDQPALRRGDFKIEHTDDEAGLLVFSREHQGKKLFIAINRGSSQVDLSNAILGISAGYSLKPIMSSNSVSEFTTGNRLMPHSGMVFSLEE